MLPEQFNNILNIDIIEEPSLTYKLDAENGTISGRVDGLEAIIQAVNKILGTERYAYVIYSAKYGVELESLIGKDLTYITAVLEKRITEALLEDERILKVTDFEVEKTSLDSLLATFTINTVVGTTTFNMEVQVQ